MKSFEFDAQRDSIDRNNYCCKGGGGGTSIGPISKVQSQKQVDLPLQASCYLLCRSNKSMSRGKTGKDLPICNLVFVDPPFISFIVNVHGRL